MSIGEPIHAQANDSKSNISRWCLFSQSAPTSRFDHRPPSVGVSLRRRDVRVGISHICENGANYGNRLVALDAVPQRAHSIHHRRLLLGQQTHRKRPSAETGGRVALDETDESFLFPHQSNVENESSQRLLPRVESAGSTAVSAFLPLHDGRRRCLRRFSRRRLSRFSAAFLP